MTVKIASVETCRELLNGGERMAVLDVRTPGEYEGIHAAGAYLMPLDRLDAAALLHKPTAAAPLYVICGTGKRSGIACERLQAAGLEHVFSVDGGTVAWAQAGLPVTRGRSRVISLERQVRLAAGLLVLLGSVLGLAVHPGFLGIAVFVGAGLTFSGITDFCGMGLLLARMPWNRGRTQGCAAVPPTGKSLPA